jgi:hypothetical protein
MEITIDKSATINEDPLTSGSGTVIHRLILEYHTSSKIGLKSKTNSLQGNPFISGIMVFAGLIGYLIYHKRTKL